MTHSGGKPHNVGDRGQRYEIRFTNPNEKHCDYSTLGWCETLDSCRSIVAGIKLHPVWHSPVVLDRETGEVVPLDQLEQRKTPRDAAL